MMEFVKYYCRVTEVSRIHWSRSVDFIVGTVLVGSLFIENGNTVMYILQYFVYLRTPISIQYLSYPIFIVLKMGSEPVSS